MMAKSVILSVDVYGCDVLVVIGAGPGAMRKAVRRHCEECTWWKEDGAELLERVGDPAEYVSCNGKLFYGPAMVVWLKELEKACPVNIATAVHELSHVANQILKKTGVGWDEDNDEAQCYLLGCLVRQLLEKT